MTHTNSAHSRSGYLQVEIVRLGTTLVAQDFVYICKYQSVKYFGDLIFIFQRFYIVLGAILQKIPVSFMSKSGSTFGDNFLVPLVDLYTQSYGAAVGCREKAVHR